MIIRISTTINAPQPTVFDFFTNFPESAKVLHSAFKTEFVTPHTTGLGAEWTQYDGDPENPEIALHKVIAFKEPNSYSMTSDDQYALEAMDFKFVPSGNATTVSFHLTIKPKSFFANIATTLFWFIIRNYMKKDLARMKHAIEAKRNAGPSSNPV
ncbi:MAG TPA: SRPBCC family protein [Fimbriimonas sp.]|nr:SRPBCC family protein [Fimbriimonas sp.]